MHRANNLNHFHVLIFGKYVSCNPLEPSGPVQACTGIALLHLIWLLHIFNLLAAYDSLYIHQQYGVLGGFLHEQQLIVSAAAHSLWYCCQDLQRSKNVIIVKLYVHFVTCFLWEWGRPETWTDLCTFWFQLFPTRVVHRCFVGVP